ncbi:hypothetical protein MRB53_001680 [Persea americana]|uniref:Uncharacterized protein n=1 Tax=Persea americana TaxID=3435 RepID=A0ACC2MSA4_PERAE|nr:hypothetical protein MRB53_001680 [Persea americana]
MMWALRRTANSFRSRSRIRASRTRCAKSGNVNDDLENGVGNHEHGRFTAIRCLALKKLPLNLSVTASLCVETRSFSSHAGDEDNLNDEFLELDAPPETHDTGESNADENNREGLLSEVETFDDDDDAEGNLSEASLKGLDLTKDESGGSESGKRMSTSELLKVIMDSPQQSIHEAIKMWFDEGNRLGNTEISFVLFQLRKRRELEKALKFLDVVEHHKSPDLDERDYASHLDLIAKVHGLEKAEKYFAEIPKLFQGQVVYQTLLANCAAAFNAKKAEEVFNKMRDLGIPLSAFSCNQLLLLYARHDKKKVYDLLLMMEKEHVKPTQFTYQLLLDAKGRSEDISGMEQVFETMKAEEIEPGVPLQALVARYYITSGLNEKADAVLKEMEGENIEANRAACKILISLYAALGKADEVSRIWKVCEARPLLDECAAAIIAWGKLGQIAKAEAVFDIMVKRFKRFASKHYAALLNVYADHKLLVRGKELVKRMSDDGYKISPLTWNALVKLYAEAGEVEKAESILEKAIRQNPEQRLLYSSYMVLLEKYAEMGDIHNAEKIFHRLRKRGYTSRIKQYKSLLQAYVNAKAPAYGFRERMKADYMFPNEMVALQLAQVDAFGKP